MIDTREEYYDVFNVYAAIGVGVFVLVCLVIVVFAVRFRHRGDEDAHGPFSRKESRKTPVEAAYLVLLTALVAFLVFFTFSAMDDIDADAPADISGDARTDEPVPPADLEVDVASARWNWRFDYPDHGITIAGTGTSTPTLVVPVGNVRFDLTTLDVIHSFFIPHLRFKRDAFPGRITRFTLGFDTPGVLPGRGVCAQYCGLGHLAMDFGVLVLPPEEFRRWARAARARQAGA